MLITIYIIVNHHYYRYVILLPTCSCSSSVLLTLSYILYYYYYYFSSFDYRPSGCIVAVIIIRFVRSITFLYNYLFTVIYPIYNCYHNYFCCDNKKSSVPTKSYFVGAFVKR